MRSIPSISAAIVIGAIAILLAGCAPDRLPLVVTNERPGIELTAAPAPLDSVYYQVYFSWISFDPDGRIDHQIYAVDPPAAGDTAWVRIEGDQITLLFESTTPDDPLPDDGPVISTDFHVFVIKAVDQEGLASAPAHRAFTSHTVAPQSQITLPWPSRLRPAVTPTALLVHWYGIDPDAVAGELPVGYRTKLASILEVQQALGLGTSFPSQNDLQTYFERDAPDFAGWQSLPEDSTSVELTGLADGVIHYFAVVAIDEAGAYEPRFLRDSNLLAFLPSLNRLSPKITVFNEFMTRTQVIGQASIDERYFIKIEVPDVEGKISFNWFAEPGSQGTLVTGYRWVYDPPNLDIFDETPRQSEDDVTRWSNWSISTTSAAVDPNRPKLRDADVHHLIIQARDSNYDISMVVVEMMVITPSFDKPLLVFDDVRAGTDRLIGGTIVPYGNFPIESTLDTLLYAVGGKPWQYEPLGRTTSDPGVFAGFDYDTLDYRFTPFEGLSLSVLSSYQAVVWLISPEDAGPRGGKFTSNDPMAALRFINTIGETNTLAVYLGMGGKAWLLGGGVVPAIAYGYFSRFQRGPFPSYPFTSEGDAPSYSSILWPGNFLYDFLHARSEIDLNTRDFFPTPKEIVDLVPYLPKHRTPGAPWPPVPGETPPRGSMDDPRVGPASERNLDATASAEGWGIPTISQDLPMLTITTEWPHWPRPLPGSIDDVSYIAKPNYILEDHDGDPATLMVSRLDTLYLMRAVSEVISESPLNPDGKPVFFYYWGEEHGPVAWTSIDIWMFERTQLQILAEIILNKFGLYKTRNPSNWTGPGSAHDKMPRVLPVSGNTGGPLE